MASRTPVLCSSLQRDDIICLPRRTNRLGIVSQTAHDVSEDSDDQLLSDGAPVLRPGQARVYWYPSGKTAILPDKVNLKGLGTCGYLGLISHRTEVTHYERVSWWCSGYLAPRPHNSPASSVWPQVRPFPSWLFSRFGSKTNLTVDDKSIGRCGKRVTV